jgi:hypothetical protein
MESQRPVWRLVLCLGWIQDPDRGDGSCVGNMFDTTLPGSLGIAVYQDHYRGHYRKETAAHVMMLWKYKPLNQDDAFDPRWVQASKRGIM